MTDSQKDLVLHLLRQGQWSDAVAAYCEETGHDQETARAVVRQLALDHNIRTNRRWWILAFMFMVASCAAVFVLLSRS